MADSPASLGTRSNSPVIDSGTSVRACSATPGPAGSLTSKWMITSVNFETLSIWGNMQTTSLDGVGTNSTSSPSNIPDSEFKLENLVKHVPAIVIAQIPQTSVTFNITTSLRLAHFLAQCGHESGGFKHTSENLNYSAARLKIIFPKYFPRNTADSYARQPAKVASRVYANRMGNGDEASGDGYKFRGRGYIQLTGKSNYIKFAKFIGEDTVVNPDLVAEKYPLASAAFFFDSNGLWKLCDEGATDNAVTHVTKRVNGGVIGLNDRIKRFKEYYALLK